MVNNTDVIFLGKCAYQPMELAEMAQHAMEDLDPAFAKNVQPDDILVTGKDVGGCSLRKHATTCLKAAVLPVDKRSCVRL